MAYRWMAASLGQLGRIAEGSRFVDMLRQRNPSSIAAYVKRRPLYFRPPDYEHLMDGLAKAGWSR